MFVEKIKIKEFRGIKETKEWIRLKKFNIVLGRNNSGKTTLLEALSLLPNPSLLVPLIGKTKIDLISNLHNTNIGKLVYGYEREALIDYYYKIKKEKNEGPKSIWFKISKGGVKTSHEIPGQRNILAKEVILHTQ